MGVCHSVQPLNAIFHEQETGLEVSNSMEVERDRKSEKAKESGEERERTRQRVERQRRKKNTCRETKSKIHPLQLQSSSSYSSFYDNTEHAAFIS